MSVSKKLSAVMMEFITREVREVIGDKNENGKNTDSSYFGLKGYLHQFGKLATSVQQNCFGFEIKPKNPKKIPVSKLTYKYVYVLVNVVAIALVIAGYLITFGFGFSMEFECRRQEAIFNEIYTTVGLLAIASLILLSWDCYFKYVLDCEDVSDSPKKTTKSVKGQNSNYVKTVSVKEKIKDL